MYTRTFCHFTIYIVDFKLETSGTFILVDHSIFRAFNKGAIGMIKVEGNEDLVVYSGKQSDTVYIPEGGAVQDMPQDAAPKVVAMNKSQRLEFGKRIYEQNCMACHQAGGKGLATAFPPLANSDFLNKDKARAIHIIINGLSGKINVNGQEFDGVMPAQNLSDEDVANVLTYIYNTWGNSGMDVSPGDVASARH